MQEQSRRPVGFIEHGDVIYFRNISAKPLPSNPAMSQFNRLVPSLASVLALGAVLFIGTWAGLSYAQDGLVAMLVSTDLDSAAKIEALKAAFKAWGPCAPVAYILFVTAEVVIAPLPGLMLYAPGGIIFGGFLGGLYALIGNLLGAAIACQVMRLVGTALFGHRIRQNLNQLQPVLERRGLWIVFLLRLNPLTSTDLVSYAAGLTLMPMWKLLSGTALGMAPLCWLQSYLAEGLLTAYPTLFYPLLVACALYMIVALWVLVHLARSSGRPAVPAAESEAPQQGPFAI